MSVGAGQGHGGEWRRLRFESIAECKAEIARIVEAQQAGQLRAHGKWSAGQVLAHVAAWIEYGYVGYPIGKPPFFIRWILRLGLGSMFSKGMSRGVKIPGVKGGTTGADEMPTLAAAERLYKALDRLESVEEPKFDSPAFGAMSKGDRIRLNLRHAELHLGYLSY